MYFEVPPKLYTVLVAISSCVELTIFIKLKTLNT